MEKLKEDKLVRQRPDEGWRRWFYNPDFDLILWYDKVDGDLIGYQVCYDKTGNERAFTWDGNGLSHRFISSKEKPGISSLASSVLAGDAGPVENELAKSLELLGGDIPYHAIIRILKDIKEYSS